MKKKYKGVVFSGLILTKNIDGIQRFVLENLKFLDGLLQNYNVILALNKNCSYNLNFKNIKVETFEVTGSMFIAEQKVCKYAKKKNYLYVNFANTGAIYSNSILVLHDLIMDEMAKVYTIYKAKNLKQFIARRINRFTIKHKSIRIMTVSNFSKSRIEKLYHYKKKIDVIYSAWQHVLSINDDKNAINKYNLKTKEYYFMIGNLLPHKNIKWVIEIAKNNPHDIFAVSGRISSNMKDPIVDELEKTKNIRKLGYVTDEEMIDLVKNAKAIVYPTLIEGFGLPPMEAMALGTPAICSNIDCLNEVYGDSVTYIDPFDYSINIDELSLQCDKDKIQRCLDKYSWEKTANSIFNVVSEEIEAK